MDGDADSGEGKVVSAHRGAVIRKIQAACSHEGKHRMVDVDAVIVGNWAAHGVIDSQLVPSPNVWTVTYVPSGLCLGRADDAQPAVAVAIATALDAAAHEVPDYTAETGAKLRAAVNAARRSS